MIAPYLKALVAAAYAGVVAALGYLEGGGSSSSLAALVGVGAGLGALAAVWAVPNLPPKRPAGK